MDINEELLSVAESWTNSVFLPFVKSKTDNGFYNGDDANHFDKKRDGEYISCPFYFGLTDEYQSSDKKRIMIIGQEARGFGSWVRDKDIDSYKPKCSQIWSIEYLQKQLNNSFNSKLGISFNHSNFWQLFRALSKDFAVCWNNVDKVYFGKEGSYKGTLTYAAERQLSMQYKYNKEKDKKSLLQREIHIAKPTVILFVTGPTYHISMETAFGLKENTLHTFRPTKTELIRNITDIINIKADNAELITVLWSYHPNFIYRNKSIEEFANDLKAILNK